MLIWDHPEHLVDNDLDPLDQNILRKIKTLSVRTACSNKDIYTKKQGQPDDAGLNQFIRVLITIYRKHKEREIKGELLKLISKCLEGVGYSPSSYNALKQRINRIKNESKYRKTVWYPFDKWCRENGKIPLPASPETINEYLSSSEDSQNNIDNLTILKWIKYFHSKKGLFFNSNQ
jgi:hypothetical protein